MPTANRPKIRPDALQATCFNSGMELWLYDEAALPALKGAELFAALRSGDEERFNKVAKPLLKEGRFLGVSLPGDGAVDLDICLGEPLSTAERKPARWLKEQKALLRLSSGALRVESNDCFQLNPDATDKGALVRVPPGDYLATLYRIDDAAMKRDGLADTFRGARLIITLTPGDKAKPVKGQAGLLPFEPTIKLAKSAEVSGNTARCQVWFESFFDTFYLGLKTSDLHKLGLTGDGCLQVSVPALGFVGPFLIVHQRPDEKRFAYMTRLTELPRPAGEHSEWGYGYPMACAEFAGDEYIFCQRNDGNLSVPEKMQKAWLAAEARAVGDTDAR